MFARRAGRLQPEIPTCSTGMVIPTLRANSSGMGSVGASWDRSGSGCTLKKKITRRKQGAPSSQSLCWLKARVTAAPGGEMKAASAGGAIQTQEWLKILPGA